MANTFSFINKHIVTGSSTQSLNFSGIPQTYTDLVLLSLTRSTATGAGYNWEDANVRFNGDSSGNTLYVSQSVWYQATSGNTTSAGASTGDSLGINCNNNSYSSNGFCSTETYIYNYTSTANKPISVESMPAPALGLTNETLLLQTSVTYTRAVPITSMEIFCKTGFVFVAGSSFYLYGIKNT